MAIPESIFSDIIFTRRAYLLPSVYIKSMHPKTEVRPDRAAIRRILDGGWVGQAKIHGHRAQIHVPSNPAEDTLVYNRQGQLHAKTLSKRIDAEVRRLFAPTEGWTVIDGEWLKPEDRLFVFDILKRQGRLLADYTYEQRYELLPRIFSSDCVEVLPLLRTADKCMEALASEDDLVEGIVLKALTTPGFRDTSVVRCRKQS